MSGRGNFEALVAGLAAGLPQRQVAELSGQALNRLEDLLADPTPNVALKAVELALGAAERWRLLVDQDARIAALEAQQDDTQNVAEDSDWARVGVVDPIGNDQQGTGGAAPQRHRSAA